MDLDKLTKELLHKKAEENNTIDLNAYAMGLTDLKKQLALCNVSNRREQLEAFVKQIKEDNELTEEINFQDINKFLASNCC